MTFNPLANDTDVDGTLDGSTVIFIDPPAGATLSPDGKTLTFPAKAFTPCCPPEKSRSARRRIFLVRRHVGDVRSSGQRRRERLLPIS
ncbi:MAG: hypothetical protein R3C28_31185 [Pirellulaceae bacterium]